MRFSYEARCGCCVKWIKQGMGEEGVSASIPISPHLELQQPARGTGGQAEPSLLPYTQPGLLARHRK